jgi:integrase
MAKRVRAADLETREARKALKVRGKPYYRAIGEGLHLGYRKGKRERVWVLRRYVGNQAYTVQTIAEADDLDEANGLSVLTYWQAQDLARGKTPDEPKRSGTYKVADAIRDYLVTLEGRASYTDTKHRLAAHAAPLADTPVSKLTTVMLRDWHKALAKAPKRVRGGVRAADLTDGDVARQRKVSANRVLGLLKAALNHAFYEDKVKDDSPWRKVKPFPKVNRSRASYLQLAECKRLINASDPEFRILVRAALESGARYGELGRLRVKDFNADAGTLTIHLSKSGSERHIELTEDGQAFFADLVAGRGPDEPMLRRKWKPSEQLRPMKAACVRAKITPVGFHQLRHTWASLAIMGGLPLPVVARNLGHSDTRMVEKHYGHLANSYVKETVRKHAPRFGKMPSNVRAL